MDEKWNEEEGVLALQEFRPTLPQKVSIGIQAAKDPVKRKELKEVFLSSLRATGDVVRAAQICTIPKSLAYQWRESDPEFCTRWDKIIQSEMLPHLEAEALRRAINGSDLLMIFMLKAMAREKYDDKAAEKQVNRPSVVIQIKDIDNSLIAVAGSETQLANAMVPESRMLDGKKEQSPAIEAEFETITVSTDESSASTKGVDQK